MDYAYDVFYYFINNKDKRETVILRSDGFLGEIGETIDYKGDKWVITDYSHEFFKAKEEDFDDNSPWAE